MDDDESMGRDQRIRERAYQLWIEEGQPNGRADDHWHAASRRVDEESSGAAGMDGVETIAADPAAEGARRAGGS